MPAQLSRFVAYLPPSCQVSACFRSTWNFLDGRPLQSTTTHDAQPGHEEAAGSAPLQLHPRHATSDDRRRAATFYSGGERFVTHKDRNRVEVNMKGITVTSAAAAACCLAASVSAASSPSGTFGIAGRAFAGLDARGGAVGTSSLAPLRRCSRFAVGCLDLPENPPSPGGKHLCSCIFVSIPSLESSSLQSGSLACLPRLCSWHLVYIG